MEEFEEKRDEFQEDSVEEKAFDLNEIKKRKEELLKKAKEKKNWLIYGVMFIIAWFGYHIRTKNLPLLEGKWLPDVDSYAFLRYAEYIVEHGKLMALDTLRYHPFGFDPTYEFGLLSYTIAYLYKILHFFNPSATVVDAAIQYPPIAFFIAAIFFFLFVKKVFNFKIAIVATAFLTVVPPFLYRTMAGVSDKEALAIMFFFGAFYFFASAMKTEKIKEQTIYGILAGIFTGLTGAIWGGVAFMFLTFGTFAIIGTLFHFIKKKHFYVYCLWMFPTMIVLYISYPMRYNLNSFLTSFTTQIMLAGFLTVLIFFILSHPKFTEYKEKIETKMPLGLFSLIAIAVLGIIFIIFISGTEAITNIISNLYTQLTHPLGTNRWQLTVAENHQPYFTDWIGQLSWKYIWLCFGGAALLFYNTLKKINKKTALNLTVLYSLFLITFSMSRYSPSSAIFNGETTLSQFTYIGSLILFLGVLVYGFIKSYYHKKELFKKVQKIATMPIFLLIWFTIMIVAARSAIRLLFVFAPITAIFVGYLAIAGFEKSKLLKKDAYKIIALIIIIFLIGTTFISFSKTTMAQASYVGPSFNLQWQNAMSWARENTPEDAVFAHWWDYGYWVQWGANRATISDGGNAFDGINHFVGRHVLTGQSEREALEFLKARNVSHLLIIKEEIGKYPAFSSIGADVNYDRYSWINTFVLQPDQTRETRNQTLYFYTGGTPLDDDLIYQDQLFPAGSSGIGAFMIPVEDIEVQNGNETTVMQSVGQPKAIVVYNGIQKEVPLKCIYINGQEITFPGESLEGCLRVMPTFSNNNQINPIGSALYLSPDVYKGLFAKLFLLNHESEYFKLAYSDENSGMPLGMYNGQLIGPLKIWEVSYPDDLVIPPEYYINQMPDIKLNEVK